MTDPRRYPLADLVAASGLTEAALGRAVGLSGTTLKSAREIGFIERAADKYAARAGLPASSVWMDWGDDALPTCAADGCEQTFFPYTKQALYCSATCRQREKMRRYRSTPHGKANNQKWRKAWYAECREYDIAQTTARRARKRAAA